MPRGPRAGPPARVVSHQPNPVIISMLEHMQSHVPRARHLHLQLGGHLDSTMDPDSEAMVVTFFSHCVVMRQPSVLRSLSLTLAECRWQSLFVQTQAMRRMLQPTLPLEQLAVEVSRLRMSDDLWTGLATVLHRRITTAPLRALRLGACSGESAIVGLVAAALQSLERLDLLWHGLHHAFLSQLVLRLRGLQRVQCHTVCLELLGVVDQPMAHVECQCSRSLLQVLLSMPTVRELSLRISNHPLVPGPVVGPNASQSLCVLRLGLANTGLASHSFRDLWLHALRLPALRHFVCDARSNQIDHHGLVASHAVPRKPVRVWHINLRNNPRLINRGQLHLWRQCVLAAYAHVPRCDILV